MEADNKPQLKRMYSMEDLLSLARNEHAEELKLHVGKPPVIVREGEHHVIEGPDITPENTEQFLLEITDTRQRRYLRERGWMQFFYPFRGGLTRFLVLAKIEDDGIGFDIQ